MHILVFAFVLDAFAAPSATVISFCEARAARLGADPDASLAEQRILRPHLDIAADAPLTVLTDAPDLVSATTEDAMRAALAAKLDAIETGQFVYVAVTGRNTQLLRRICTGLAQLGVARRYVPLDHLNRRGMLVRVGVAFGDAGP